MDAREKELDIVGLLQYIVSKWCPILLCGVAGVVLCLAVELFQASSSDGEYAAIREFSVMLVHDSETPYEEDARIYPEQKSAIGYMLESKLKDPEFYLTEDGEVSFERDYITGFFTLTAIASTSELAEQNADDALDEVRAYLEQFDGYGNVKVYVGLERVEPVAAVSISPKYIALSGICAVAFALLVVLIRALSRKDVNRSQDVEFYAKTPCAGVVHSQGMDLGGMRSLLARAGFDGRGLTCAIVMRDNVIEGLAPLMSILRDEAGYEIEYLLGSDMEKMVRDNSQFHVLPPEFAFSDDEGSWPAQGERTALIALVDDADMVKISQRVDRVLVIVPVESNNGDWLKSISLQIKEASAAALSVVLVSKKLVSR